MGMGIGASALGSLSPQQQQQLLSMIQSANVGAGGQGSQTQAPPMPQQSQQQQMQGSPQMQQQPQMPRVGSSNIMLPSGNAAPGVSGVPLSATPPRQQGSMSSRGIAALPGAVFAVKQKMQQDKVQKARALAGQYLALQQSDDPKLKQAAQTLITDPKNHKVFDKAVTDPNSPEYQGVQLAYRDLQNEEQAKVKFQEMRAQMEQQRATAERQQAEANQAQATANLRQTQADQAGQVTPLEQAKLDEKMKQVTSQLQTKLQQTDMQTKRMLDTVKMRVKAEVQSAQIRASGTVGAALSRGTANDYIIKEYKVLDQQLTELDRQSKDLQSHLDKTSKWYGDADDKDDVQRQLAQIDAQRGVLTQQFQLLQNKDQAFQRSGLTSTPPPGPGKGTKDDPIVIP